MFKAALKEGNKKNKETEEEMIEIALVLVCIFFITVFFYKQHTTEFSILQIEHEKLETLPEILSERKPTVIRGLGQPKLFTPETLTGNQRLLQIQLQPNYTIGDYLKSPRKLPPLSSDLREHLANESGLQVWAEHMWFPRLVEDNPISFLMSMDSEIYLDSKGMEQVAAAYTIFYPTSGEYTCSIVSDSALKFLPSGWQGRYVSELTAVDCPLLHEIQYMDIVLRPGHMLIMPAHWIVSMKANHEKGPCMFATIEIHHPVSKLAKSLA